MKTILILTILLAGFVFTANGQHEYAPLGEQKIKYKDWTYANIITNEEINLRKYAEGKKLVMVFYFAPWCHSSKFQAPITQKFYEKYKDAGLGIIGVSLYGSVESVLEGLDSNKITFPVVTESTSKFDREESKHYKYRTSTGDDRKWGTPWNIFIIPSKMKTKGDVLVKKAFVVNGEIVEEEAEAYIRQQLGLPAESKIKEIAKGQKDEPVEICDEDKVVDLQKPS